MSNLFTKFNTILNAFASMVYISIGIFALTGWTKLPIKPLYQTLFGILLTAYGLFRAYRFYSQYIQKQTDEEN